MSRIKKIQRLLEAFDLAALVIDKPIDLYYVVGKDLSLGRLVVSHVDATLFVDGRYYEACQNLTMANVMLTSGYDTSSAFFNWWPFAGKRVGFDADETSYAEYRKLGELGAELIPLTSPIKRIREIKDEQEIGKLKLAAELGSKGFDFVCTVLKEGITEKKVALELEMFWLRAGGEKLAFSPHIAFGEGTSQPHYRSGERRLKKGDLIMIDIGVVVDHYHSDMTRVIGFGEPDAELKKIYHIVYEAHQAAAKICHPGKVIKSVDDAARHYIEEAGYKDNFPHGLGHGVGLEIHESPRLRHYGEDKERALAAGMAITIEPGIYLPGRGGVRLEDTYIITNNGAENITCRPLSPSLPIL